MDRYENYLGSLHRDSDGEIELEFYRVTSDMINVFELMLRNGVTLSLPKASDRPLLIIDIRVYHDEVSGLERWLKGPPSRNMDVTCREQRPDPPTPTQ